MDLRCSKIKCSWEALLYHTLIFFYIVDHHSLLHRLDLVTWWLYYCFLQMLQLRLLTIISLVLLDSRIFDWEGLTGNTLRRANNMATGWQETASEPLCHFSGQCWVVNQYLSIFSFSWNSRGFWILLRSRLPNNPFRGSWSVTTMIFGQPMTNIWHFSNAHAIAAASLFIGAYLLSTSVQNLNQCHNMKTNLFNNILFALGLQS